MRYKHYSLTARQGDGKKVRDKSADEDSIMNDYITKYTSDQATIESVLKAAEVGMERGNYTDGYMLCAIIGKWGALYGAINPCSGLCATQDQDEDAIQAKESKARHTARRCSKDCVGSFPIEIYHSDWTLFRNRPRSRSESTWASGMQVMICFCGCGHNLCVG